MINLCIYAVLFAFLRLIFLEAPTKPTEATLLALSGLEMFNWRIYKCFRVQIRV